jgi:predicted nucleic acid-binding Zn ribbon protein
MTNTPSASGADLARQALAAARANAKHTPTPQAKKTRPTVRRYRSEHADPQGLAGVLGRLTAEQGWTDNLDAGSITDRWPDLCPQYVGHIEPAGYDETTGRLDLRPDSHSYAAQLRMFGGQLAKQINDKLGRPVVRTIRVLPVGNLGTVPSAAAVPDPERSQPEAPVKTRETASPGYRATLEAALAHKLERQPGNPYVAEADARQVAALRAHRQAEDEHREAQWAGDQSGRPEPGSMEASIAAAKAYARSTARGADLPRAFDVA